MVAVPCQAGGLAGHCHVAVWDRGGPYVAQATPLSENAVGAASLFVQVPWKPKLVLPPGLMAAL